MQPNLVVRNVKQLTIEIKDVFFLEGRLANRIIIVNLAVVLLRSVAKILLDESLIVPSHLLPSQRYVRVLTKRLTFSLTLFLFLICFVLFVLFLVLFSVPNLVITNMREHLLNVKPVARVQGERVLIIVSVFFRLNKRNGLGFLRVQFV